MPAYNEEAGIEAVLDLLRAKVLDRFDDAEVIVVDDASTDATGTILDGISAEDPRVLTEHLPKNQGHGYALRKGLDGASGDWIFQIDSDDHIDAEAFWDLWANKPSFGLVMGVRTGRRSSWFRRSLTGALSAITRVLGAPLQDPNVPFKLFPRELWHDLEPAAPEMYSVPSAFISFGAALRRRPIIEIPVKFHDRRHGRSIGSARVAATAALACWELTRFYFRVKREPRSRTSKS
jgi:glycosyltransferase involved in cell wall biosynthesis